MFSSCNLKFSAVRHIHYPVNPSSDHFNTDAVVPSSDHCCTETVLPSSALRQYAYCQLVIITALRQYRHLVIITASILQCHLVIIDALRQYRHLVFITKVALPSEHLHTKRT